MFPSFLIPTPFKHKILLKKSPSFPVSCTFSVQKLLTIVVYGGMMVFLTNISLNNISFLDYLRRIFIIFMIDINYI